MHQRSPATRNREGSVFFGYRKTFSALCPNYPPLPCWNRHNPGQGSAAGSGLESAANPTGITARIGGSSPPDSGTGSAPGKTAMPRQRSARLGNPNPRLQKKTSDPGLPHLPQQPEPPCTSRSRIAGPWPHQKRQQQVLCSVVRIDGYLLRLVGHNRAVRGRFPSFRSTVSLDR
jgi:hypothetical protein